MGLFRFSPVGHSGFLLTSLGSRRRPVTELGLGVRLVVLWVSGLTAVMADAPVVSVPSSYLDFFLFWNS